MLDGIHRPPGRLFSYTHPQESSSIPEVCGGHGFRCTPLPISSSSLRPVFSPSGVHKGHGGSHGFLPQGEDSNCPIPRRPLGGGGLRSPGGGSSKIYPASSLSSRLVGQLRKIRPTPRPCKNLPGHPSEFTRPDVLSPSSKAGKHPIPGSFLYLGQIRFHQNDDVSAGPPNLRNPSCPVGSGPFQNPTRFPPLDLGRPSVIPKLQSFNPHLCKKFPSVVDKRGKSTKRSILGEEKSVGDYNRCQPLGLGGTHQKPDPPGSLARTPIPLFFKPEGIGCSLGSAKSFKSLYPVKRCKDFLGQQYHSGLHQQARGNKKPIPLPHLSKNLSVGREEHTLSISSPLKRRRKYGGRFFEQKSAAEGRMETESQNLLSDSTQIRQSLDRPVCFKQKLSNREFLLPQSPGLLSGSGRLLPVMEKGPSIRFSSFLPHPKGPEENPGGQSIRHSNRPILAEEVLVSSPAPDDKGRNLVSPTYSGSPSTRTYRTPFSVPTTSCSLDTERIILKNKGLSDSVVSTLLQSRKPITSSIYLKIWNTFLKFSEENSSASNISLILDFLQAGLEKGLKTSTLKVQIAAISAISDQKLAEHPWIRRFIQASRRIQPSIRSSMPPWDLNLVLSVLSGPPFEPLEESSLRNLSLKTTFLLAITTARRVGEIQAFSSKPPYLTVLEDRIILKTQPSFLPKVVSSFHCQQEIVLPSFCSNPSSAKEREYHSLDVRRCVLQYLQTSQAFRKDDHLLLQFQGVNKGLKASKITIARWIKMTISTCYGIRNIPPPQSIRAHSTRAVATSWAELANVSIEQICKAATWANPSTFFRHYRLDVAANMDLSFGRRVLSAVVPP